MLNKQKIEISSLKDEIKKHNDDKTTQSIMIMELEEKVNSSEGSSGASGVEKKLFSSLFNSKFTKNEAIIVSRVKKDIAESEQIVNNIIISGL